MHPPSTGRVEGPNPESRRSTCSRLINAVLSLFYPEVCSLCESGRARPEEGYVCAGCASDTKFVEPPWCERCGRPYAGALEQTFVCSNCSGLVLHFSSARSAVAAKGKVLEAIHAWKYNSALWVEPFLVGLLACRAVPALAGQRWDMVVPVPLHTLKQRERGFNQSARLAKRLAGRLSLPFSNNMVKRRIYTPTQTRLDREARHRNMRNAFESCGSRVRDARVILVDDVFTTGATANACAQALLQGGAREVCVWTLARGI